MGVIIILSLVIGKKGSGKTLFAVNYIKKTLRKEQSVYTNFPVVGCFMLSADWYSKKFPENSLIVIDEAQLLYNSRNWSKSSKDGSGDEILRFTTMIRHYKVELLIITQQPSRVDNQFRDLADDIVHLKRTFKLFIPLLQIGQYFDDVYEYDHYLQGMPYISQKLYRFVSLKSLRMYDTHIKDEKYINSALVNNQKWEIKQTRGFLRGIFNTFKCRVKGFWLHVKEHGIK
jgi:hypothetical protein